jgi:hypothetical protein
LVLLLELYTFHDAALSGNLLSGIECLGKLYVIKCAGMLLRPVHMVLLLFLVGVLGKALVWQEILAGLFGKCVGLAGGMGHHDVRLR